MAEPSAVFLLQDADTLVPLEAAQFATEAEFQRLLSLRRIVRQLSRAGRFLPARPGVGTDDSAPPGVGRMSVPARDGVMGRRFRSIR